MIISKLFFKRGDERRGRGGPTGCRRKVWLHPSAGPLAAVQDVHSHPHRSRCRRDRDPASVACSVVLQCQLAEGKWTRRRVSLLALLLK